MRFVYSSPLSFISLLLGMFFMIYLWLPLFFIFVAFAIIYIIFSYIFAKITGRPTSSVKIVRVYRHGDTNNMYGNHQNIDNNTHNDDVIDSTTVDKD